MNMENGTKKIILGSFLSKKEETISMIDTLAEFKELKNIDKDTMISVLEDSFRNVIAKMFGTDENYDVIINLRKVISRYGETVRLWLMMNWRMRLAAYVDGGP